MIDTTGRHPSTTAAVRGLRFDHLPDDPELTDALRLIRRAKDNCVLLAATAQTGPEANG